MRVINNIVIHCTATPADSQISSIQSYWRDVLKWKRPGYHYLIDARGNVTKLQDIKDPTNGVAGHNADSVHISYIGGVVKSGKKLTPSDTRTPAQKAALIRTIKEVKALLKETQVTKPRVLGHKDFPGVRKACPSFDARTEYAGL